MPIVTITTTEAWKPGCEVHHGCGSSNAQIMLNFRDVLPDLMCDNAGALGLEVGTTPDGVLVDFQEFSRYAKNNPDIWIYVIFTESPEMLDLAQAERVLANAIKRWSKTQNCNWFRRGGPTIGLDIFAGPGHGRIYRGATKLHEW